MSRPELERQIADFCQKHDLLPKGAHVTVALSGGADSMALFSALLHLQDALGLTVSAAHFHHGLRADEADRDAAFVQTYCRRLGVQCHVGHGDVRAHAKQSGSSLEAAARELRYAFFAQLDTDLVATAHNADDNAETLLLHLLRGTGTRGFAGIPPKRGRYIRPLLCCTREQILHYLSEQSLPHVEDSTNTADDCTRNRLRRHVMPLLRNENPALSATLLRSCEIVRQEDAYLSSLARNAEAGCKTDSGWSCAALNRLDPVLRRRILLNALQSLPLAAPSFSYVEALESLSRSATPSARLSLPEGWVALREYDTLRILRPSAGQACPCVALQIPGNTDLPEIGWKIRATVTENSNILQKNLNTFLLRYDMIAQNGCFVRARQVGDTLQLPGGRKTLKRLMIDRKIPAHCRDRLPVIVCGSRVAAVFGLACDEAFRAVPGIPAVELSLLPLSPSADISANDV